MIATQPKNARITREAILKKHAAFFAVGDRARTFRTGGLLASAAANRQLGHGWRFTWLMVRAVSIDPKVLRPLLREVKGTFRRRLQVAHRLVSRSKSNIYALASKTFSAQSRTHQIENEITRPSDWDSLAERWHNLYGYLSHDYSLIDAIIRKTKPQRILEIGCGSGRLVSVYLLQCVESILLQDISGRALDICRQRFFCQQHIRYFVGPILSLPESESFDLIVSRGVLMAITDDNEVTESLRYLVSRTRYFFINEAQIGDRVQLRDNPYLKKRNYVEIFNGFGFRVEGQGEITAEFGTRQSWMLFAKREGTTSC
jgi:SAM-dependent methyltransferase